MAVLRVLLVLFASRVYVLLVFVLQRLISRLIVLLVWCALSIAVMWSLSIDRRYDIVF